jgi:hypothetical protein
VFQWPADGKLVVGGLKSDVKRACLLADTSRPLRTTRINDLDLAIEVGQVAPDKVDSVVLIECAGDVLADPVRLLQPEFAADTLRTFDGTLHGKLRFGPGKKTDAYVQAWTQPEDYISWEVRLNKPASFDLSALYDADAGSAGNQFVVETGHQALGGNVQAGKTQDLNLGEITLPAGRSEIQVKAKELKSGELFKLRRLVLTAEPQKTPEQATGK